MHLECIETIEAFEAVHEGWDRVFAADPEARHFLSWNWLRSFLRSRKRWIILALREDGSQAPYVAFFPLRLQTSQNEDGSFYDEIIMAGNYVADYTGFIALPGYDRAAISAFSAWLKRETWMQIKLDYICGPPSRTNLLVRNLSGPTLLAQRKTPRNEQGNDNSICPVIELPSSWEAYLEEHLSSQTRQKLRRFLRKVENNDEYSITETTAETVKRDLDILLAFWSQRWTPSKGEEKANQIINQTRAMLLDCFENGNLSLPVLWHGTRPLGALANITDREKREILFYITGRDEDWKNPAPGLVLHGYCIRNAIDQGFKRYDFLRGNEPYKYMFGVQEIRISCTTVKTKTGQNPGGILNRRSIDLVYKRALRLYHNRKLGEARRAFEQVVKTAPHHFGAAFGIANICLEQGMLREARAGYERLLNESGQKPSILLKLADIHLAEHKFKEAIKVLREVTCLAPQNAESRYKLGVALIAMRKLTEARKVLLEASGIKSKDKKTDFYAAKAQKALLQILTRKAPSLDPVHYPPLGARTASKVALH